MLRAMTADDRRTAIKRAQATLQDVEGWDWLLPAIRSYLARMVDHVDDAPAERARMARALLGIFNKPGDASFRNTDYAREVKNAAAAFAAD